MLHGPVLVGTNLTPGAEGALRQAAGLARDLGGRLIVCHVMPELLRIGMLFPQWRGVDPRLVEAMTTKARDAVSRELASILGDQPLSIEIVLDSGTPHVRGGDRDRTGTRGRADRAPRLGAGPGGAAVV
jgi:nucleotide-binding universal stress UspA family protein